MKKLLNNLSGKYNNFLFPFFIVFLKLFLFDGYLIAEQVGSACIRQCKSLCTKRTRTVLWFCCFPVNERQLNKYCRKQTFTSVGVSWLVGCSQPDEPLGRTPPPAIARSSIIFKPKNIKTSLDNKLQQFLFYHIKLFTFPTTNSKTLLKDWNAFLILKVKNNFDKGPNQ